MVRFGVLKESAPRETEDLERDAPRTAWIKMIQPREEVIYSHSRGFAARNLEQNVPRTDWIKMIQPREEVIHSHSRGFVFIRGSKILKSRRHEAASPYHGRKPSGR